MSLWDIFFLFEATGSQAHSQRFESFYVSILWIIKKWFRVVKMEN